MSEKKLCPFAAGYPAECSKSCALWIESCGKCAIAVIAEALDDISGIIVARLASGKG